MIKCPCTKDCPDRWATNKTNCRFFCAKWKIYWEAKEQERERKKLILSQGQHTDAYYRKLNKLKRSGAFFKNRGK